MPNTEATPVYLCPKVATPPVIDGKLDDEAWAKATPIRFVLTETGKPATKKTIARMCWDDDNLYISYDCEDEDVWGTFTEHDDPIFEEECCEAFLCPAGDLKSYFEINVSPLNVTFDALIVAPARTSGKSATGWTCEGLRTAVVVDGTLNLRTERDRGWSAEMAIPFKSLDRPTPKVGEQWRANLYRIDRSPEPVEFQAWSPTLHDPADFHIPERFGTIIFK